MKPNAPLAVLALAAMAAMLTGCSNAVMDPKYERNPNPRQKYVVTAKIEGAPGPFKGASADIRYKVGPTQECMPDAEPFSGTFPTPSSFDVVPPLRRISEAEYRFDVYLDAVAERDYFGKGVCTWEIESVNLTLKPTNNPKEQKFVAHIGHSEVIDQLPISLYVRRDSYGTQPSDPVFAFESALKKEQFRTRYKTAPTNTFIIMLEAKEQGHDD
jgi:hypothetical protein